MFSGCVSTNTDLVNTSTTLSVDKLAPGMRTHAGTKALFACSLDPTVSSWIVHQVRSCLTCLQVLRAGSGPPGPFNRCKSSKTLDFKQPWYGSALMVTSPDPRSSFATGIPGCGPDVPAKGPVGGLAGNGPCRSRGLDFTPIVETMVVSQVLPPYTTIPTLLLRDPLPWGASWRDCQAPARPAGSAGRRLQQRLARRIAQRRPLTWQES